MQFGNCSEQLNDGQLRLGLDGIITNTVRLRLQVIPRAALAPRARCATLCSGLPEPLPREDIRIDLDHETAPQRDDLLYCLTERVYERCD